MFFQSYFEVPMPPLKEEKCAETPCSGDNSLKKTNPPGSRCQ